MGFAMIPDDAMEELSGDVRWVGDRPSAEVYPQSAEEHLNDEVYWSWGDSGWRGYLRDESGYWVETDGYGTFWASEETSLKRKELDDAYAAFEDKARAFAQSKTFQRAKGGTRGFYLFGTGKGKKRKPKGNFEKGKGYGGWKGSSSSTSASTTMGKPSNVLGAMAVNGFTGCFICGDRNHGFRQCPNRASGSGQSSGSFRDGWTHEEQKVYMMMDDRPVFGVLDIGATETVGSLEATEKLCQLRGPHHAKEMKVIPHGQKSFGLGKTRRSGQRATS